MAREIFVISDTHLGHENIIKYCDRPFYDVHDMNETIIDNWNKTVRDDDIIYHLGDVYFRDHSLIHRLRGRKRLVLGNHDIAKDQHLQAVFQKILMWRQFPEFGLLLTHVPVHPNTLNNKWPVNVHGHIHNRPSYGKEYKNVSVEMINYTPINIEELRYK